MSNTGEKIRMILKFDTGADGFLKMIYVLLGTAFFVLIVGVFFLVGVFPRMFQY